MNDVILIEDLTVQMVIGVHQWERAVCQSVIINAKLYCDFGKALYEDDLAHTINYQKVCEDIESVCQKNSPKLLEYLAGQILQKLFEDYPINKIELCLKKPHAIHNAQNVGIVVVQDRHAHQSK